MADIPRIEPDFSVDSNFNEQSGISRVKFGADAPVLEVELNELQQIQDKAREDLIRSMIPSGFTKLPKLNFTEANITSITTSEDAEAYVNGMRIFIPSGTRIDLGEPPEKDAREDLVFLEVWKQEIGGKDALTQYGGEGLSPITNGIIDNRVGDETSHRIINRWRIRTITGVDFNKTWLTAGNNPSSYIGWNDDRNFSKVYAQGANADLKLPAQIFGKELFRPANANKMNSWYFSDDTTLWVAGVKDDSSSKDRYKTTDGLVYAIPMFKIQRRPKGTPRTGDYNLISPLCDVQKLSRILGEEKVAGINTGEIDFKLKGRTLENLITKNPEWIGNNQVRLVPRKNVSDILVTLVNLSPRPLSLQFSNLSDGSYSNVALVVPANACGTIYVPSDKLVRDIVGNSEDGWSSNNIYNAKVLLLEGRYTYDEAPKQFFDAIKSAGEDKLALRSFIKYSCSTTQGTAIPNLASFNFKPKNSIVRIIPVDTNGKELSNESNIAYKLLDSTGNQIKWTACNNSQVLTQAEKEQICSVRMFSNDVCPTYNISGFNIYDGSNIILRTNVDNQKESVKEVLLSEPLRGLKGGLTDTLNRDGVVVRHICKVRLDGTESYTLEGKSKFISVEAPFPMLPECKILCDRLPTVVMKADDSVNPVGIASTANNRIRIKPIAKNDMTLEEAIQWLKNYPIEVYYEKQLFAPLQTLPSGVSDIDNSYGQITRNVKTKIYNGSENWDLDSGYTQNASCLRFRVRTPDRIKTIANNRRLMDLYCPTIITQKDTDGNTLPRLWNYWEDTIYLDVNPNSIGINFSADNDDTKISKFKNWLKSNPATISYQLEQATVENYEVEQAIFKGDLYFNNESTKVICDNAVVPEIFLSHKANLTLNTYEGRTIITSENSIPPTIETSGVCGQGTLSIDSSQEGEVGDLVIKGQTYQNLIDFSKLDKNYYSYSNGIVKNIRYGIDDRRWDIMNNVSDLLKPKTDYTFIVTNLTPNTQFQYGFGEDVSTIVFNGVGDTRVLKFTTSDLASVSFKAYRTIDAQTDVQIRIMLLEGDWTNKEVPNYITEIESVGEKENNKISILSHGKNLLNLKDLEVKGYIPRNTIINENEIIVNNYNGTWCSVNLYKKLKPNTKYFLSYIYDRNDNDNDKDGLDYRSVRVCLNKADPDIKISQFNNSFINNKRNIYQSGFFTTDSTGDALFAFYVSSNRQSNNINVKVSEIMLVETDTATSYEPHKEDKKEISLPIKHGLKSLPGGIHDTIEQRADGFYLVQRVGKLTLADLDYWVSVNSSKGIILRTKVENVKKTDNLVSNLHFGVTTAWDFDYWKDWGFPIAINTDNMSKEGYIGFEFIIQKAQIPSITSLETAIQYFKVNNAVLYYELTNPVEYRLTTTLKTTKPESDYGLAGQVGYKATRESAVNINKFNLDQQSNKAYLYMNQSRVFNYNVLDGDVNAIFNLINVPLTTSSYWTPYTLRVLEVLPNNQCLVRCEGSPIGGQNEWFRPYKGLSTTVNDNDVISLAPQVSLTGFDFHQKLDENLYELMK